MSYSTNNRPYLLVAAPLGGVNQASTLSGASTGPSPVGGSIWAYRSSDALATVTGSSYFSEGWTLGMRKFDHIIHTDINSTLVSWITVTAITTGAGATATSLLTS